MRRSNTYSAKPFVKWVGGKTQLLSDIRSALPHDFSRQESITYVEPFVGGGAVLFWILQEYSNIKKAVINDINEELICTYKIVKNNVEELIAELKRIQMEYLLMSENMRKDYYIAQRIRFNCSKNTDVETAALFIFLNRTCFNGLYRVNSKGEFNVPYGKYANPRICDEETLRADSVLLQNVEILCGDFAETACYAGKNVLFYLDPPYRPLSETSSFTSYSRYGFNDAEQIRLRDFCEQISSCKSLFVASNSDPRNIGVDDNFFDYLYNSFYIKRVSASRMINSRGERRGSISELIISNVAK